MTTDQPTAGPMPLAVRRLCDRDLRDVRDQIREVLPIAPPDLRPGYEGALRAVLDEIARRDGAEPQPVELLPCTVEATGLDVDQQLRAAALQAAAVWAAAVWMQAGRLDQVLDRAETWATWIRDGSQ